MTSIRVAILDICHVGPVTGRAQTAQLELLLLKPRRTHPVEYRVLVVHVRTEVTLALGCHVSKLRPIDQDCGEVLVDATIVNN